MPRGGLGRSKSYKNDMGAYGAQINVHFTELEIVVVRPR